jgi:2-hydroxymuconate-semialdehyde hydrolase
MTAGALTIKSTAFGAEQTAYLDEGSGPVVLLLHGSGPGASALANWRLTIPALSDARRIIAPDLTGYGGSTAGADAVFHPAKWATQSFALLDTLGITTFSVIGNSLGGRIAMEMALDRPERIEKIVFMGSGGLMLQPTPALTKLRQYQPSITAMGELIRDCFLYDATLATEQMIEDRYHASIATFSQYTRMFSADRSALVLPPERIATIAMPSLVVHGRDDKVIPSDNGVMLSRLLPDADLLIFKKCGHWAQFERAADFNAAIRRFFVG